MNIMEIKRGTLVVVKKHHYILKKTFPRLTTVTKKERDGTFLLKGYGNWALHPEGLIPLIQIRKKEERQNLQIVLKNHHRAIIKKLLTMAD